MGEREASASTVISGWRERAWSAVSTGACLASVAGAVGFFLTSEALLLGAPVALPLIALVASKQQQKLRAEALAQHLQTVLDSTATPAQVQTSTDWVVAQLQEISKASDQASAAQMRALHNKLGSLEGTILSAGRSAHAAASNVQSSTGRLADANSKQLHSLRGQLLRDISELLPEATSDPMPLLRRLDRRLQGLEDKLASMEAEETGALRNARRDIEVALQDAEVALQATVRTETDIAAQQELAIQAAAGRPVVLGDTQWNALGTRLTAMGAQIKALEQLPTQTAAQIDGLSRQGSMEGRVALTELLDPLVKELKQLQGIVQSQGVPASNGDDAALTAELSNSIASLQSMSGQLQSLSQPLLDMMMRQDRLDSLRSAEAESSSADAPAAAAASRTPQPDAAPVAEPQDADLQESEDDRQRAYERMQALLASKTSSSEVGSGASSTSATPSRTQWDSFSVVESNAEEDVYLDNSSYYAPGYQEAPTAPVPLPPWSDRLQEDDAALNEPQQSSWQHPPAEPAQSSNGLLERAEQSAPLQEDLQQFYNAEPDAALRQGRAPWQYNSEEHRSHRERDQGWGDYEGLLDRGGKLLRHARRGVKAGADLGAIDACLQDTLECFKAAAEIEGSDSRSLGNWGITLLEYGQHKRSYLSMLEADSADQGQQSNGADGFEALGASRMRLRSEARQALVRAGQLFKEVVLADEEDMGPVSRRSLVHWAKALCLRADLADNHQDARQLWQSAVDKLQAVISADPSNASALRAAGLALMDLAALPDAPASDLLQDAKAYLKEVSSSNPTDEVVQSALQRCQQQLRSTVA
ncbi:hypothetical protein WJX73_003017 [Symbiochloris irregularis]|uniref:Uncharacterized protein n=1 Tax=Symbiochloris irregularis TaxID=706552 RepID=A0AAW1NRA1_9CHLO